MKQRYDSELHRIAHMGKREKIVKEGNHLVVKKRWLAGLWDWLFEDAHLSRVFERLRSFLAIQGGAEDGLGQEIVIEDLAGIKQKLTDMKRRYDRRHGFFFRLVFDPNLDVEYSAVIRQIDYTLATVARREMKRMNQQAKEGLRHLRDEVVGRWLTANEKYEQEIVQQLGKLGGELGPERQALLARLWRPNGKERVHNSQALLRDLWRQVSVALFEGEEIKEMIEEEMQSGFYERGDLAVSHHNEILSRLSLWRSVVREQKRTVFDVLQDWHQRRQQLLEELYHDYEEVAGAVRSDGRRLALEKLKELLVTREKEYLEMLGALQSGVVQMLDILRDGIRRVGRSLLTDEYLSTEMSPRWLLAAASSQ